MIVPVPKEEKMHSYLEEEALCTRNNMALTPEPRLSSVVLRLKTKVFVQDMSGKLCNVPENVSHLTCN